MDVACVVYFCSNRQRRWIGQCVAISSIGVQNGGGAFFLPYLIALFVIGIPILILELSLGQFTQSGDIISFARVHRRLAGIGVGSVLGAFAVVCYYNIILAWSLIYLYHSFSSEH
eukprot:GABV01007532.1.p1 GENE.GABV01007532.1~~GABV01007532.1.p1  ORF type:complete len:115 (-),score=31.36 GABV01007532.1:11-355(-)